MEKGKLLGKGVTAEVFEWGQDKVVKLYFDWFKDEWIDKEKKTGKIINNAGLPSPEVFDRIEIDGRRGLIFERINGESMLKQVEIEPMKSIYYIQKLARLQFKIHNCSGNRLISQKEKFQFKIDRSSDILGNKVQKILDYIDKLPDGDSICHGDLHFDNIIVTSKGPVVIDWNGAYRGCPLGDVARTCMMLKSPYIPIETSEIFILPYRMGKQVSYWTYINEYMRLSKASPEDIDAWTLPVAAARLADNLPGEKNWLLNTINERLKHI
jgi:uncharacterized protein (TIGR02172 family)